jgi:hypothetical protein
MYDSHEARLVLHYDDGLRLYATGTANGGQPVSAGEHQDRLIWTQPYENIKGTGDDGQRFIWLDFGNDQPEVVSVFRVISRSFCCIPGTGSVGQSKAGGVHSPLVPLVQSAPDWLVRVSTAPQ